jgi:hypothetical protein
MKIRRWRARWLVLLAKTERGLAELDAGKGIDHAEAKR